MTETIKKPVNIGLWGAVLLLGGGIFLYFQFKPQILKIFGLDGGIKGVNDAIKNSELSYKEAEYSVMASQLKAAMAGVGTDCDMVYSVLSQLKTSSDWYELLKIYGTPSDQNLVEWFQHEWRLDNAIIQSILGKIGISYYNSNYSAANGRNLFILKK